MDLKKMHLCSTLFLDNDFWQMMKTLFMKILEFYTKRVNDSVVLYM